MYRARAAAVRARGQVDPHTSTTGQAVNEARPHWTETCSYCGMALPKPDESCPNEIIDRAAAALTGENREPS